MLIDQNKFEKLSASIERLDKEKYIRAYTKATTQFIDELTNLYDPPSDLIDKNLNQTEIDTTYSVAKHNIDQIFDKSLPFLYHIIHLHAFDISFLHYFKANARKIKKASHNQSGSNMKEFVGVYIICISKHGEMNVVSKTILINLAIIELIACKN